MKFIPYFFLFFISLFLSCNNKSNPPSHLIKINCLSDLDISLNESLNSIVSKYPKTSVTISEGEVNKHASLSPGNLLFGPNDYPLNMIARMDFNEKNRLHKFEIFWACIDWSCNYKNTKDFQGALKVMKENGALFLDEFDLPDNIEEPFYQEIKGKHTTKNVKVVNGDYPTVFFDVELNTLVH